jgi:signal transduction histidine kinase
MIKNGLITDQAIFYINTKVNKNLRRPGSQGLAIQTALQRLITSFQNATNLTIHFEPPDNIAPLSTDYRLAFYRTAQEALTNVQGHAQAHNGWVTLLETENE